MPDRLDRILFWLENHRATALGVAAVAVLAAVAILIFGGGKDTSKLPKGAVAVVGRQPISRTTFDHWLGVYRRSGVGGANPTPGQANRAVLQILVAASWTEQEAAREKVSVSDARVNQAVQATFAQAKSQGVTRQTVLKQVGGTVGDLAWEERASLLGNALQQHAAASAPKVTQGDIARAYADQPARWAHPSRRDVQVLLARDRASAASAAAALKAGQPWPATAKAYGSTQIKSAQTTLRGVTPGTRDEALERAVFAAPVHQVSAPTLVASGWVVFQVQRSTPISPIPLSAASKTLRSEIVAARQTRTVSDFLTRFRREWKARTTCLPSLRDPSVCGA